MKAMKSYGILLMFLASTMMSASFESDYILQPAYLTELLQKLNNGENVIFTKFGDGEYACMTGSQGHNCDGDTYHSWLGDALKKALIGLSKKTNAFIGRWHYSHVYEYCNALAKKHAVTIPFVSYHLIMHDDTALQFPYMHQFVEFLVNTKRKKIIMANSMNHRLKDLFRADVYIEIPCQSWSYEYETWKQALEEHVEKDAIVLIAGGLCSKVLINDITDRYDVTCIDIGSSFDVMGGKIASRQPRLHSYEDELAYYKDLLPCADEKILIEHVKKSIEDAKNSISKLDSRTLSLEGMSSSKVRHLLNNLCSLAYASYLEVGVWQGSTLVSALFGNSKSLSHAVAVDNWSQFRGSKQACMHNIATLLPANTVHCYDHDFFTLNKQVFQSPVNIYFYDGDHAQESHYKAFTYFNDAFADVFIAVIDDWNHCPVQLGTRKAFQDLGYQVLFEEALNGLYVSVIKKS